MSENEIAAIVVDKFTTRREHRTSFQIENRSRAGRNVCLAANFGFRVQTTRKRFHHTEGVLVNQPRASESASAALGKDERRRAP